MEITGLWMNPIFPPMIVAAVFGLLFIIFVLALIARGHKALDILFSGLRVFLILLFIFAINLRPMRSTGEADVETRNLDVLFVVDTTISMWAEDYDGHHTRISGVMADCEYIMKKLAGANFGLIRFDNRAQILAPFTQDVRNVTDALDTIKAPDDSYATGSDLSAPVLKMQELLKSSSEKEDRKTIVFFISDGEITNQAMLISYAFLQPYVDNGAVLGYGTKAGGRMKGGMYTKYDIYDPDTGQVAVSKLDEENLMQIAKDLKLDYIYMDTQEQIDSKISYVLQLAHSTVGQSKIETFEDTYQWLALPLMFIACIALLRFIFVRKL